jgi:hypothetical protein|tara:strand:+ start:1215 stop:1370 length:156 start_codon:yes stop_codon:yes gene_type:complete
MKSKKLYQVAIIMDKVTQFKQEAIFNRYHQNKTNSKKSKEGDKVKVILMIT